MNMQDMTTREEIPTNNDNDTIVDVSELQSSRKDFDSAEDMSRSLSTSDVENHQKKHRARKCTVQ